MESRIRSFLYIESLRKYLPDDDLPFLLRAALWDVTTVTQADAALALGAYLDDT